MLCREHWTSTWGPLAADPGLPWASSVAWGHFPSSVFKAASSRCNFCLWALCRRPNLTGAHRSLCDPQMAAPLSPGQGRSLCSGSPWGAPRAVGGVQRTRRRSPEGFLEEVEVSKREPSGTCRHHQGTGEWTVCSRGKTATCSRAGRREEPRVCISCGCKFPQPE